MLLRLQDESLGLQSEQLALKDHNLTEHYKGERHGDKKIQESCSVSNGDGSGRYECWVQL